MSLISAVVLAASLAGALKKGRRGPLTRPLITSFDSEPETDWDSLARNPFCLEAEKALGF